MKIQLNIHPEVGALSQSDMLGQLLSATGASVESEPATIIDDLIAIDFVNNESTAYYIPDQETLDLVLLDPLTIPDFRSWLTITDVNELF